jgi:DNA modification methylase
MTATHRKYTDEAWDFTKADTKAYTHCLHNYPAMMIPQIARELLNRYGTPNGWVLDPYCGTGTSLVEASMFGMNSVGCDINPLVRLIATAKTTPMALQVLEGYLNDLNNSIFQVGFFGTVPPTPIPDVLNLANWFSKDVTERLSFLRASINAIEDEAVRNFCWVAFSETVRECSYTRNGEFKLHRMPTQKMEAFQPDVFGIFQRKLIRNRRGFEAYLDKRKDVDVFISGTNTANREPPENQPSKGFDLVITSPPYGDSQTTVAYGQFSRLSADWIGLPNSRKVDRMSMGGNKKASRLCHSPVDSAIEAIRSVDEKRARQVEAFYIDLESSINAVAPLLAKGSTICYVVGNRRVKGVTLPTDEFISFAFGKHGFLHEETIVRNIPNKRMPKKNSPSNIVGQTDVTMHEENIVICQRSCAN